MAELPASQKKISQSYSGNLGYFRRPHYLRSLRFWCFTITAIVSVVVAVTFNQWGSQKAFSTGPISENHAHLANNCQACHSGANNGMAELLQPKDPAALLSMVSLKAMDAACIQCHPTTTLHAPQTAGLVGTAFASQLQVVHATSCASCHREHTGQHRLASPANHACTDCHNDSAKLEQSYASSPKSPSPAPSATGVNLDLGDGLARFIPPPRKTEGLPPFASFPEGHPGFGYERPNAQDPADLKFNHARHFRSDIPQLNNAKLDCASCHQTEPNGAFYQPVRYEKHCQQCHSLQIQQSLPKLLIPHGDPEKVRHFLASLDSSFYESFRAQGTTDPVELSKRVDAERQILQQRGLFSLQDLEERVFLQGDPQTAKDERLMRSGNPKFLTECAKCHSVTPGTLDQGPTVQSPNVARRWLQAGTFNHRPHQNMKCADCHEGATKSKLTSDILLPTQQSCTECHHPPTAHKEGVKASCQSCHHFHSSASQTPLGDGARKLLKTTLLDHQP